MESGYINGSQVWVWCLSNLVHGLRVTGLFNGVFSLPVLALCFLWLEGQELSMRCRSLGVFGFLVLGMEPKAFAHA